MRPWQKFENLVADIHKLLDKSGAYEVLTDQKVTEPAGASHQVDVLLKPASPFTGPILVSCKSGKHAVTMAHVREWSDIVHNTGAAAGVIVAESGFTSDAIPLAKVPSRRLSLWVPRRLTLDDFGPDEKSEAQPDGTQAGYIAGINMRMVVREPRPRTDTWRLEIERVGAKTGRTVQFQFSSANRDDWYLRNEEDRVVDNLWDRYVEAANALQASGLARVIAEDIQFLVLGGVRHRFKSFAIEVDVKEHVHEVRLDLREDAFGYENVATGEVRVVPLPANVLDLRAAND
jgi:hypothetical protein